MPSRLDPLTQRALTPTVRIGDCVVLGALETYPPGPCAIGLWVRGGGPPAPVVVHRVRAMRGEIEAAEDAFFAATAAAGSSGGRALDAGTLHPEGDAASLFFEELIEGLDLFEVVTALGVPRPGYELGVRLALMRRVLAAIPAGYAYDALTITPTTLVLGWGGIVRVLPRMPIPEARRIVTTRDDHDLHRWPPITPETAIVRDTPPRPERQRVFQTGAVLAWIATGVHPFGTGSELERLDRIARGDARVEGGALLERYPRIRELLLACLVADPRDRPESTAVIGRDLAMAIGEWSPGGGLDLLRRQDQEDPVILASRIREQFLARSIADQKTYRRIARDTPPDAPPLPFARIDLSEVSRRTR
jgi:hypothetical protein